MDSPDHNQRNIKQPEVEELFGQSGKNLKGCLPSMFPFLSPNCASQEGRG